MPFAEMATASIVGGASYEWLREKFSVKAVIILSLGALLLFLVLSGDDKLGKFWRGIQ